MKAPSEPIALLHLKEHRHNLRKTFPALGNRCVGYVYLVTDGETYKIGQTGDVCSRMTVMQKKVGRPLQLLHVIQTSDRTRLENHLFDKFSDKHLGHEWFALTPVDVEYIMELAV